MQNKVDKNGQKHFIHDIILVLALLVVGLAIMIVVRLCARNGIKAVIKQNGVVIAEISLAADGEYPLLDGKNILAVSGGSVYMKSADCPHKECVYQGKKSKSGEWIYCLPNKLSITVE